MRCGGQAATETDSDGTRGPGPTRCRHIRGGGGDGPLRAGGGPWTRWPERLERDARKFVMQHHRAMTRGWGFLALSGFLLACLAPTAWGDAIDDVTQADHITIRALNYDYRDVRAPSHDPVDQPNQMVRELDVSKPAGTLFFELDPARLGRSGVNFTIQARGTRQVDAATRRPYIHWDFRRRLPAGSGVTDSMGVFHAVNDAEGSVDTFADAVPSPVEFYDGTAFRTYRVHLSLRDQGSDDDGPLDRASFGTLGFFAHML